MTMFSIHAGTLLGQSIGGFGSTQIVLLGMAIIALSLLMRKTSKRVQRSREPRSPAIRDELRHTKRASQARQDLEAVMVELEQLSREIQGRIDTRFAKLESVIRDADHRIERLTRLVRASQGGPAVDVTVDSDLPPSNRAEHEPSTAAPQQHSDVYRLADAGMSAERIAAELSKTAGEIELILALRRTRELAAPLPPSALVSPP